MLDDRDYMRQSARPAMRWSATLVIIVINIVVFVIQNVVDFNGRGRVFDDYFALSSPGLERGYVWQLLTFQFMHAGPLHILGNLISIYIFGHLVEEAIGKSNFVKLYLTSGMLGGLVQVVAMLAWPAHFGGGEVMGASAGGIGLIAAFATLFPNRPLYLFFLPFEIRARVLLWLAIATSLVGAFWPSGDGGVAHFAHLGGIAAGWGCIAWMTRSQKPLLAWRPFTRRTPRRELVNVRSQTPQPWQRPKPVQPEELPPAEFMSREVDPILDKISAHGIQSLTDRERQVLEAARKKMSRR